MAFEHRTVATAWGGSDEDIAAPDGGGGNRSPAARIGRLGRMLGALSQSPWAAVALRGAAILIGMAVLAAIGLVSMSRRLQGTSLLDRALARGDLGAQMHAEWLAPTPVEQTPAASPDGGVAQPAEAQDRSGCDAEPRAPGVTPDGKVILNSAGVKDLTRLPGVGRRRAEQIIELRTRLKRFRRVTDLLRVRGIGVRGLRRLQPHIVLDPPATTDAG
jgi:competence protein ComEA